MLIDKAEAVVEGVVDGLFRNVFRGRIQPLEIARQLTRHAEEAKIISLSRVYVPNRFVVGLHGEDMAALQAVAPELEADFQRFVGEWVAEHEYTVSGPIRVELRGQERVGRGKIRITCSLQNAPQPHEESPTGVVQGSLPEDAIGLMDGVEGPDVNRKFLLFPGRTIIGRGADCDIRLRDPLTSRHHATIEPRDGEWWLVDLDSTNGSRVNEERIKEACLQDGDTLQLGASVFKLRFQSIEEEIDQDSA